jgi:hypothetical protein
MFQLLTPGVFFFGELGQAVTPDGLEPNPFHCTSTGGKGMFTLLTLTSHTRLMSLDKRLIKKSSLCQAKSRSMELGVNP